MADRSDTPNDLECLLAKLDEMYAASTQGEWRCDYRGDGSGTVRLAEYDILTAPELLDDSRCPYMRGEVRHEDGEFAAEAHNAYPALRDEIRRLRELVRLAGNQIDDEQAIAVQSQREAEGLRSLLDRNEAALVEARTEAERMREILKDVMEVADWGIRNPDECLADWPMEMERSKAAIAAATSALEPTKGQES